MKPINKPLKTDESFHNLTDEELVAKIVKTNNTVLFGIIYDRYDKVVYNKCHSFARREEEAQDLAQDVFLKLYINLGSFQGKSKFSTWLYALTYNYCVNYLKRDTAKAIEQHSVSADENDNLLVAADDLNLHQLRVDKLKKSLQIINPEDKMILLLKYQDDAHIKDISSALDLTESAVKMRIKRAKGKLIKIYNEVI